MSLQPRMANAHCAETISHDWCVSLDFSELGSTVICAALALLKLSTAVCAQLSHISSGVLKYRKFRALDTFCHVNGGLVFFWTVLSASTTFCLALTGAPCVLRSSNVGTMICREYLDHIMRARDGSLAHTDQSAIFAGVAFTRISKVSP